MVARILKAFIFGVIGFLMVVAMAIIISYIKCLATGVSYDFERSIVIAIKGGAVTAVIIFCLALIGAPRREG